MATAITPELESKGIAARAASRVLSRTNSDIKNQALENIAKALETDADRILAANALDMEAGKSGGLAASLMDRLLLNPDRLKAMADGVRVVAALPDPIGQELDSLTRPDGLIIARRRVPLGVVGVIYESRPNVTVDIAVLCFKSGNACILRGGKEAINSNAALASLIRDAIDAAGGPQDAVQFVDDTDRALVLQMLGMKEYIDLLVPRGSAELVNFVGEQASMPAITGGIGVCHTYVDPTADLEAAVAVVTNAKVRRPSVCNALDTVLVHSQVAQSFLSSLATELGKAGVRCDVTAVLSLCLQPRKRRKSWWRHPRTSARSSLTSSSR